jgi:hypothetical protein
MLKIFIYIYLFLFSLFGVIWYPVGNSYVDKLYQHEYSIYESEKSRFDSIETNRINIIKDSIYNAWLANNDTTLKTIKKINKKPNYGAHGYHRKTDKLICKYKDKNEAICEPEKEWIITDYYINGYVLDTLWTDGYDDRNQWLNKANIFVQTKTNKISPKKEFGPYKASTLIAFRQNFSYVTRNVIGTLSVLIFSILLIVLTISVIRVLVSKLDTVKEDVEDSGDIAKKEDKKEDKQETFMNKVVYGVLAPIGQFFAVCFMALVGFTGLTIILCVFYLIIVLLKYCFL